MMAKRGIKVKMKPPHPGDFIRTEVIEDMGLSVDAAAEILGVSAASLSDLLTGQTPLTPEMALRLNKSFAVGMELLLGIQAWYDEAQMRDKWDKVDAQPYAPAWAAKAAQLAELNRE